MSKPKTAARYRFWDKVDVRGPDDCWEWTKTKVPGGYGNFWDGEKSEGAHRMAWRLMRGIIPIGMFICHHCDNPSCCNPNHLFIGTQVDNMMDMKLKGRSHKNSKLNVKEVVEIRRLFSAGGVTHREIGKMFNISRRHISQVVNRKRWRHINAQPT